GAPPPPPHTHTHTHMHNTHTHIQHMLTLLQLFRCSLNANKYCLTESILGALHTFRSFLTCSQHRRHIREPAPTHPHTHTHQRHLREPAHTHFQQLLSLLL